MNQTESAVLAYVRQYGKDGWLCGFKDNRFLQGEEHADGMFTPARVKDLFFAVYLHQKGAAAAVISDDFDRKKQDELISEAAQEVIANK